MAAFDKGGAPALLFLGVAALLLLVSRDASLFPWWMALGSLLGVLFYRQSPRLGLAGAGLVGFSLFLLANAVCFTPAYHPAAIYLSFTFLLAFLLATSAHDWLLRDGFRLFSMLCGLVAAWAVAQWLAGWGFVTEHGARAQALFATPNTLATAINLALAPLLALYLLGRGGRLAYWLLLLLFAGLLASQSRGGYFGLIAAMLFFMLYAGRERMVSNVRCYARVAAGFAGVGLLFKLCDWLGWASWSLDNVGATLSRGDTSSRWEIYRMAWPLLLEHFWQGIGYFNFGYYWQMHKVAPFLDGDTLFVHNDYLQLAVETGIVGIGLFLLLIAALYGQLFRHRRAVVGEVRLPLIMAATAITSMLAHALVDFPFYIPALIAVFGAGVGIMDRQFLGLGSRAFAMPLPSIPGLRPGFLRGFTLLLMLGWLGLPAFAEAAAAAGLAQLQHADARWGLYWHELARSLQPRAAEYYWRSGVILRDQGLALQRADLLAQSDATFAAGLEANPFELKNLLERSALHRQHGNLLAHPASPATLLAWMAQARQLRPYADSVQVEYVRVLAFAGQKEQAIAQAEALVKKRPRSGSARMLRQEVAAGKA